MHGEAQKNYYDVLDVSPQADDSDIKLAYRRLVLFWHPDRRIHAQHIAEENLKEINEAYTHIKNKPARAKYNKILQLQQKSQRYKNKAYNINLWGQFWAWMTKPVS